MSTGSGLFRIVVLPLCLLASGYAQGIRPSLNLFAGGGNEKTFYFTVGSGQSTVPLVTNPDASSLVADSDSYITKVVFFIQDQSANEQLSYVLPPGFVAIVLLCKAHFAIGAVGF